MSRNPAAGRAVDRSADPAPAPVERRRPSLIARGWWWAADYVYAARRQVAVLATPWSIFRRSPGPKAWSRGSEALPEVILLPGVYEHWTFLRPLGNSLSDAGHCVRVVHGLGTNRRSV